MGNVVLDIYETDELERQLSMLLKVMRQNLVVQGMCDFFWFAGDGHSITLERKTWMDLLNSIGNRLDGQLRKATQNANEVGLLVEGVADPLLSGEIGLFELGKDGKYFRRVRISQQRYDATMAYLWRLDKEGISVYHTNSMAGTAWAVKAFVENSQKTEFTTLRRYLRTRRIDWEADHSVECLMALKDKDGYIVGEKTAKEILKQFKTVKTVANTSASMLSLNCKGVGQATARRIVDAFNWGS